MHLDLVVDAFFLEHLLDRVDDLRRVLVGRVAKANDNRELFITESDTGVILRIELDEPGKTMFSHTKVQR